MSDVRDSGRDRAAIAEAVLARVGGSRPEVAAIVDEIAGHFVAPLHRVATRMLEHTLGPAFGGSFDERIEVHGDLAALRSLAERSTLVLAPTHASNLDSLVLGTVTARAGLPPFAYASGKHIYRNRIFGALIRRLGGYKLDPDRRDRLYLRVVNVYVHELLARGYHSVIFPSGTRGRSGAVESTLKLGLLGAAVHVPNPITIVPVAINYQIVLEADHLIAYYLAGRSRERIVGDEMFVWGRLRTTARRLRSLDQRVAIRFGTPLDPRALGTSWRRRIVDELTAEYRRHTVFFAPHVVARALSPNLDTLTVDTALGQIAMARNALAAAPDSGLMWHGLRDTSDREILQEALAAWASWHPRPPAAVHGERVAITNRDLLLYYANRSAHIRDI